MINRYGSPVQENGKITRILNNTWCHQCKIKHEKIVVCDHFWDTNRSTKCNGRYCANCCNRHYGKKLTDLEKLESWVCFKCTSVCVCAACRRMRNPEAEELTQNTKGNKKRGNSKENDSIGERKKLHTEVEVVTSPMNNMPPQQHKLPSIINQLPSIEKRDKNVLPRLPNINISNKLGSTSPTSEDHNSALSNFSPFDVLLEASLQSLNRDICTSSESKNLNHKGDILHLLNPQEDENEITSDDCGSSVCYNPLQVTLLKQEVQSLTSEINHMKNEFMNLQKLFKIHIQDKLCLNNNY